MADTRKADPTTVFCKRSGYTREDILASKGRIFVTSNGGKYELTSRGIRTIMGPEPPAEREEQ